MTIEELEVKLQAAEKVVANNGTQACWVTMPIVMRHLLTLLTVAEAKEVWIWLNDDPEALDGLMDVVQYVRDSEEE